MSIQVVHSNRVEELAAALAAALPTPGDAAALFDGPWLVVPTRPLTLWLNLELARLRGISGSADTMTFDGMFARLTSEALPDVVLIERGHIVAELLALLGDDAFISGPPLAPLRSYLLAAGNEAAAIERRRVDLALELGKLFDGWSLSRPEVLERWRATAAEAARDAPPLERAERALHFGLFGPEGRFARRGRGDGRRYLTRDAFLHARLEREWRPPPAVHIFAPYDVPTGFQLTLARLGQRTELHVYALNPCREFWEDLELAGPPTPTPVPVAQTTTAPNAAPAAGRTRGGRGRAPAPDPRQLDLLGPAAAPASAPAAPIGSEHAAPPAFSAATSRENPWLAAWGRAGREAIRRLNELTDNDSHFRAVEPTASSGSSAPTLLARVQQDILDRRPRRGATERLTEEADGSLVFIGAPNVRRELESVAAEIWALVRNGNAGRDDGRSRPQDTGAGEPLRFSDIAVLIAGPAEPHLSLVPEVFHEAQHLPHTIVDRGFGARSGVADAVLGLMALPLGALTRREVLDVISHANVRARFPDAEPTVWLRLCDALTIAHGADRAALADTYIDRDAFNWDQGCRRLVLGRFARGPRSGSEDPVSLSPPPATGIADDGYIPAETDPHLRPQADALAVLMRSLLADVRFARTSQLTVAGWMGFVRAMMAAYVVPVGPDDESARLAIFSALDQLAAQAVPDNRVSLAVAVELLRAAFGDLRGARGQMLGAGVVVGSLGTLRALPFRVVFIVGLESQRFPSSRTPSPLDVLTASGGPAEPSPRDTDRYLFLEALLATRERLVLTALDRDPLTGEGREPSSVVLEFLDELGRGYVPAPAALVRRAPLHRDEDPVLLDAFPSAATEAQARRLGDAARAAGAPGAGEPTALLRSLAPEARAAVAPLLGLVPPPVVAAAPARSPQRERTMLSLADLRRFLECPLQGSARVFLGLRDLADETAERETTDEPFDLPRALERSLLNEVLVAAWADGGPPDGEALAGCYDQAVARYRAAHRLPASLFRANVRRRHVRILGQWVTQATAGVPALLGVGAGGAVGPAAGTWAFTGPPRRICFGRPEPHAAPAEARDPIRLRVEVPRRGQVDVELQGTTEPQFRVTGQSALASLVFATSASDQNNDRDSFRALLDVLATVASSGPDDNPPPEWFGVVYRPSRYAHDKPARPHALRFNDLTPAGARAYLGDLAGVLLGGVHDYLFPCDAVLRATRKDMPVVDGIEQTRLDPFYRSRSASNYGPVPNPFEYPAPPPDDATRFRDERFGLLLAALAAADPRSEDNAREGTGPATPDTGRNKLRIV